MGKISQAFSKVLRFFVDIVYSIFQQSKNPIIDNQKCSRVPYKKKKITKKQLRKFTKSKLLKKRSNKQQIQSQTSNIQDGSHQKQTQSSNKAIKEDAKASQIDKKQSNINFLSYIKQKQQEILCSICRQSILLPAITDCNHIFCLQCIEQSINISKMCPLCRNPLDKNQNYGVFLFNRLDGIISKIRKNDDNLQIRLKGHQQWKQKRFIPSQNFELGLKIDIWKIDTQQWKKGAVANVWRKSDDNQVQSILVNYQNDSNEVIQIPTLRVTSHEFYTKKQERGSTILHRVFSRNSFMIDNFSQSIFPLHSFLQTRIQNERNLFSPLQLRRTAFNRNRFNFLRHSNHLDHSDALAIRGSLQQQQSESEFNFFQYDQSEVNEIVNLDSYHGENDHLEPQSPTQVAGQVQEPENRGNQQEQSSLLNHLNPVQLMFENLSEQSQQFPEENDIVDSDF